MREKNIFLFTETLKVRNIYQL